MPGPPTLAALVPLALFVVAPAVAQQLEPGARVRGHTTTGRFDGRLTRLGNDSIAISEDGTTTVYPLAGVRRLELARGSKRNLGKGAAIGAGIGAVTGIAIVIAADDDRDSDLEGLEVVGAGAVLLGSTAIGAITGALIKSPRWTRVRPAGLGVKVSF